MNIFRNIEQEVCSLELAKRLKELGVMQLSYFSWLHYTGDGRADSWYVAQTDAEHLIELPEYAAFTVTELGEKLPYYFSSEKHSKEWRVGIVKKEGTELWGTGRTEADARANALIYLLEKKLV